MLKTDELRFNEKQLSALQMLRGGAVHNLLYGGSRSGKTFVIVAAVIARALRAKSRHAIMRFRFNHVKTSIVYDTLPKVVESGMFKGLRGYLDKTDWFYRLPNGSEIWFGGLDDKERTEKILGQEYSTLFLNECSQIPWASRNIAITRLAQNAGMRLKCYYDCNPPSMAHWTYRLFFAKRDPVENKPLANPENYVQMRLNPADNRENLSEEYFTELENLGPRERRRFLLGEFSTGEALALWTQELLDQQRWPSGKTAPDMQRVVVAVDPSGSSGEEGSRSDEIGIVVVGLGEDDKAYILDDLSGQYGPTEWAKRSIDAMRRYGASEIVAETNFGGAMVTNTFRAVDPSVRVRVVKADRHTGGKCARAEPIANLFERQKVWLLGNFSQLESQLCQMTTDGWKGPRSPDRADAMVWGVTALFPSVTRREAVDPAFLPKVVLGHSSFKRRI